MKNLDIERIFLEHGIPVAGPGDRHYREGWVHTPCPFCTGNNRGNHLGFNGASFSCWRCGGHLTKDVLKALTGREIKDILREYGDDCGGIVIDEKKNRFEIVIDPPDEVEFPPGTKPMTERHHDYLARRGFDSKRLSALWGLMGTGMAGGSYSWRIIAPVMLYGETVSYIAADILRTRNDKYRPCPKEKEVSPHKHTVYGHDLGPRDRAVVVEGISDVWRLGPGAKGTFGTSWTGEQALMLAGYRTLFLFYDPEPAAQAKAEELGLLLEAMDREVHYVKHTTDPGDMDQKTADGFMKDLGFR